MIPYVSFKSRDESPIALEIFHTLESVPPHKHAFQEFVLVTKGSCIHQYKDISMPLIPGDVFLIPPNQEHAYLIETPVSMYNCQFYPDQIASWWDAEFGRVLTRLTKTEETNLLSPADLNRQNIIHLSVEEAKQVRYMMDAIQVEQEEQGYAYQQVKQDYLNLILIIISRAQQNQFVSLPAGEFSRYEVVTGAQKFIENNLSEPISFADYAQENNISLSYFRSIFKSVTGLPPVEYLNRLRIVRAIEYLKNDALSMSDVSTAVGIYDANYFSRLFRKIIGYSPSEFRKKALKNQID